MRAAALGIQALTGAAVELHEFETREAFLEAWARLAEPLGEAARAHTGSPAVWTEDGFVGGDAAALEFLRETYLAPPSLSRLPRVVHSNDADVADHGFDFDLVVIGGGSGGLACSKEAALFGARVAVLDFVKPSWAGSRWGLGGTCVNVGCIPKKLMHTAALMAEYGHDGKFFGWEDVTGSRKFSWPKLVEGVQNHIASINFGYKVQLREKSVTYRNELGTFVDAHTLECTNKQGKRTTLTSQRFVIAVGGRPTPLACPGGEHAISSDDIFNLDRSPGKTLMIGAGYVSLECAGFLRGLGFDVSVMVRSILLRGFDRDAVELIEEDLKHKGIKFIRPTVPTRIEKLEEGEDGGDGATGGGGGGGGGGSSDAADDGGEVAEPLPRFRVFWEDPETKTEVSDVFNTVFTAVGRRADTSRLGLEKVGIATVPSSGKIVCTNEQTSVPHIYAIGDVVEGKPELTPVAIMAGKLLAKRLFAKDGSEERRRSEGMDYDKIPTTIFTPLEYGCIGYSEEAATEKFGEENLEVYVSKFSPLEWRVNEAREHDRAFAKLIVNKRDHDRVIGFHYCGPNAGEVTQGFATAMRLGARYQDFVSTVGIHPTIAEEFTVIDITKRSGESVEKSSC